MIDKYSRILAIVPSAVGFAFSVLEGKDTLVNQRVCSTRRDIKKAISKIKGFISHYQPKAVILENTLAKDSRRGTRARKLVKCIQKVTATKKIQTILLSQTEIKRAFAVGGEITKLERAEIVSKQFPEELAHRLPPKRRAWDSERRRMGEFEAVALALAAYFYSANPDL